MSEEKENARHEILAAIATAQTELAAGREIDLMVVDLIFSAMTEYLRADALDDAQHHESGDPPEGSRLWRAEKELAKARATIATYQANEGRCSYTRWRWHAGEALQPTARCTLPNGHDGPHQEMP